MSVLPDVPRLYTALAEILAALLYAQARPPRTAKPVYGGITAVWAILLAVFLHLTGHVPLAWWVPCMVTAIAAMYLYLWATREMNLREAGYSCARAFVLAELAASLEWQLHCWLWPQRGASIISCNGVHDIRSPELSEPLSSSAFRLNPLSPLFFRCFFTSSGVSGSLW